ncbi:22772_t:CDS:2, partial [Gigaspora rosea]
NSRFRQEREESDECERQGINIFRIYIVKSLKTKENIQNANKSK